MLFEKSSPPPRVGVPIVETDMKDTVFCLTKNVEKLSPEHFRTSNDLLQAEKAGFHTFPTLDYQSRS